MNKEIIFIIKLMLGGGAERVVTLLSNAATKNGYKVSLVLTHQNKKDSVLPDSISHLCEKGFDDIIGEKAISALRERFHNKNLLIKNANGDTLALWSDSSLVFQDQYWTVNTQDKGEFTGCTLQLTDEVLELK